MSEILLGLNSVVEGDPTMLLSSSGHFRGCEVGIGFSVLYTNVQKSMCSNMAFKIRIIEAASRRRRGQKIEISIIIL